MEKKRKEREGACDHEGINWGFRDTFELGSSIKFKVSLSCVLFLLSKNESDVSWKLVMLPHKLYHSLQFRDWLVFFFFSFFISTELVV